MPHIWMNEYVCSNCSKYSDKLSSQWRPETDFYVTLELQELCQLQLLYQEKLKGQIKVRTSSFRKTKDGKKH